jgi:hypothetical protein
MLVDQTCLLEQRDANVCLIVRDLSTFGIRDWQEVVGRKDSAVCTEFRNAGGQRLDDRIGRSVLILLLLAF